MTRPLHVLVSGVVLGQPMGGVRRHNQELLPRLAARLEGDGGRLAVLEGSTPVAFDLPPNIERLPSSVPYQPAIARTFSEARALRRAVRDAARAGQPFDLVHTAHLPAPRRLGVPVTRTVHDLRSLDLEGQPTWRRLSARAALRRAFTGARAIGVVSHAVEERLARDWPELTGRVALVGNGDDHLPLVARAPESPGFALHVGHVEPRKGLGVLVQALAAQDGPARVVLAGRAVGGELDRLRNLARSLGVDERLEHVQPENDQALGALYSRARCAVFPSRLEGFGIGPVEAMRAGCPTIVSDLPAHREGTGGGARTFPAGDVEALVRAIATLPAEQQRAPGARSWNECADAWHRMLVDAANR